MGDLQEENCRLRGIIEQLQKDHAEARSQTEEYRDKYSELATRVDTEIKKCVSKGELPSAADTLSDLKQEAVSAATDLTDLHCRWSNMDNAIRDCLHRLNKMEQYSKINNLLFDKFPRIPEGKKHGRPLRDFIVTELNKLFPDLEGGQILPSQIEFGHTLPTKSKKNHTVIVKFSCRFTRNAIFYAKTKMPKDCGVSVREHLTPLNAGLLNSAKSLVGNKNVWTSQARVFAKFNNEKILIGSYFDIEKLELLVKKHPYRPGRPQSKQHFDAIETNNVLPGKPAYGPQQQIIDDIKNFVGSQGDNSNNNSSSNSKE